MSVIMWHKRESLAFLSLPSIIHELHRFSGIPDLYVLCLLFGKGQSTASGLLGTCKQLSQ